MDTQQVSLGKIG